MVRRFNSTQLLEPDFYPNGVHSDPISRLLAYGGDNHALSWDSANDRSWGHLPEFWADARSLDLDSI
jgi:hypothetical protein